MSLFQQTVNALFVFLIFTALVWIRRIFVVNQIRHACPPLRPLRRTSSDKLPKISIIVPAKNEEQNIEKCLCHLFKQSLPDFELIVVNDRSTDRTAEILTRLKAESPVAFKIITIEKLPPGWTGKNYAMFTGSRAADGAWILFTDADTTHEPSSALTALETALEKKNRSLNAVS